ncbi:hypothetical protein FRB93_003276 [Tulasnella sp. JGI-2019a]|nr:hypothetical protein FRB93_003276 [Tulasnella sp. JGI-2019a]
MAPSTPPSPAKPTTTNNDEAHAAEIAQLQSIISQLQNRLSGAQKSTQDAQAALEQGRIAYAALDAKHQQFVEANVAFTHWRDDMERQRASWAEANAKFAKRHEENKAAKANLEAKYAAVVMDLEEVKERYGAVKRELARMTGGHGHEMLHSPSPPLPSAIRNAGQVGVDLGQRGKRGSGIAGTKSARGVERGAEHHQQRPGPYPTHLVEQSVLRERLTSDMFTLSQKVLEERANRAEEARQMAERRIFELESQLARHQGSMNPESLPPPPPPPPQQASPYSHHEQRQHHQPPPPEAHDARYRPYPSPPHHQSQPPPPPPRQQHRLSSPLPPPPFPPSSHASSSPVYERHHQHLNAPPPLSQQSGAPQTLPSIRSLERDRTLPPLPPHPPLSRSRHNSTASTTNRPRHNSTASSSSRNTDTATPRLSQSSSNTPHMSYSSATTSPSQYGYASSQQLQQASSSASSSHNFPPPPPLSGPVSGPPPPAMAPPPPPNSGSGSSGSRVRSHSSASYSSGAVGYHPYPRPSNSRGDHHSGPSFGRPPLGGSSGGGRRESGSPGLR